MLMLDLDICRSCLAKDKTKLNLFQSNKILELPLQLSKCYELCTSIKVAKNDNLPQHICMDCIDKLRQAYYFRSQSSDAENSLRRKLEEKADDHKEDNSAEATEKLATPKVVVNAEKPNNKRRSPRKQKSLKKQKVEPIVAKVNAEVPDDDNDNNDGDEDEAPLSELVIVDSNAQDLMTIKPLECTYCKRSYKNQLTLDQHIESVHKHKSSHLCNVCGKSFSGDRSLKSHMLQHKDERPYKCDECDKTYFTKNGLASHTFLHKPETKPATKQYLCSTCGKEFSTNQRLRIHTYMHTGERNYSCQTCNKSFATEFRLRTHLRIHSGEKPYRCTICGICFAQGNALKCHKRIHSGEKPYKCKYCDKCFSQNTILKTHMTLHTGKTVECPDCDKKFSRASYLILHRREHTGEKPYACDQCPNRYKQKSHLDRHLDTHNGVKHKCNICLKEYSKQWSLKMHMYTHTNEKPYKCTECPMAFIRRDKYKIHLKVTHGYTLIETNKNLVLPKPDTIEEVDEEQEVELVEVEMEEQLDDMEVLVEPTDVEYVEEIETTVDEVEQEEEGLDGDEDPSISEINDNVVKKEVIYVEQIITSDIDDTEPEERSSNMIIKEQPEDDEDFL